MDIQQVADIIHRIADGFEENCVKCLVDNRAHVLQVIQEQLYSGLNGEDEYLSPTYDNDPFFNEEGYWYHRAAGYKEWKKRITPPVKGTTVGMAPRPDDVPNLFIDGTFYSEITIDRNAEGLTLGAGSGNGPDILGKYGDNILTMGPTGKEYFCMYYLEPSIVRFLKNCGYR